MQLELALKHVKYGIEKKMQLQRENIQMNQRRQKSLVVATIDQIEKFSNLPKNCRKKLNISSKIPTDIKELQNKLIQKRQQLLCSI